MSGNVELTATLLQPHGAMTSGAAVKLLNPVRETEDWLVADSFGYVLAVPKSKLSVNNRPAVVMRLEAARQEALMALQQHYSRAEQAMAAARSYEIGRLLEALPKAV